MIAQGVERFNGQVILDDVVDVLVVAPRQVDAVEAGVFLVDAEARGHHGVPAVGVQVKIFGIDAPIGELAADRERIPDYRPLRFAEMAEQLSQVVDQAGDDQPAWLPGAAHRLCGLQRVFDLREVHVGIAVVDERVEKLERLPHVHARAVERQVLGLFRQDEVERLMACDSAGRTV